MIIPGILEKSLKEIEIKVQKVDKVASLIQIDVVEGTLPEIDRLDEIDTTSNFEIHLMIKNPTHFLNRNIKGGRKKGRTLTKSGHFYRKSCTLSFQN
jgi:pentose-5-phosphate-3-epimerase